MKPGQIIDLSGKLVWPFHAVPYVSVGGWRHQPVDPFPAYAHPRGLVESTYRAVTACFPLELEPDIYLLDREPPERTNGWAEPNSEWDDDTEKWVSGRGRIVLCGKRIPIHPAMTRYLVTHEYGHHVEWEIARLRTGDIDDRDAIKPEYRELRGLDAEDDHASGGTWHKSVADVFADDFRLLIAKSELEHWPHPETPRPEEVTEVVQWWEREMAAIAVAA